MRAREIVPLLAVVLLTAGLTGCLGGEEDGQPAQTASDATEGGEQVQGASTQGTAEAGDPAASAGAEPAWTHGDWWTYDITFDFGFGTLLDGPTTLVLHDVQGGYSVAAADRNAAIVDQYFDLFAVGELDTGLNPADGGLKMFDFPLEDGKSWTADIDTPNGSAQVELTATRVNDAGDPQGTVPGFEITGGNEDGIAISYTYSPRAQWITSFELVAPNFNGEAQPVTTMTLTDHGDAYEGTFVTLEMEQIYFRDSLAAPLPDDGTVPPVDTITVPEGLTFVQRVVGLFGFDVVGPSSGVAQVDILTPEDDHETYRRTNEDVLEFKVDEPPLAGEWTVSYQGLGTTVMIVGFFGFTEQVVEFTAASHANHG